MNHKLFFILLFQGLGMTFVFGQNSPPADISWGKEYKEPSTAALSKIILTDGSGVYALREKFNTSFSVKNKVYIEHYNRNMTLLKSKEVDLKYNGKLREMADILRLGNELYLFTSYFNQAQRKNYLFYQRLSKQNLLPDREISKVAEAEGRGLNDIHRYDFHISQDSSKLIIYNQLPSRNREPERFAFRVFDVGMEFLWEKEVILPYPDDQFRVEEYRVDNQGNVYLLGVLFEDKVRTRRQGKPTYKYIILAYTENGEAKQEYQVDLTEQFITDLTFRIGKDGNLVCSGFYSDRGGYSIKGTCFFRVDSASKNIFNLNLRPFDFEFVTEYLSDRGVERARTAEEAGNVRKAPELYNYKLDELILRSDGGALLVAEQYYIYERTYRSFNGTFNSTVYYNYNDIILVNIRPNGEIEWSTRIPKRQQTTDDGGYYSSYAMSIVRDRIFFVFNDNGRNYDSMQGNDRIHYFNGRNSIISLAEVQQNGSVTTYPLFSNRDADIITRPKICKQIGSREMLIYGEQGRRYKFASLQFK